MKFKFLLFVSLLGAFALGFQSCNNKPADTLANDEIKADIKTEIGRLNDKLFKAIMANDTTVVRSLLSPELIKRGGNKIDTLVASTSKTFNAKAFDVLDQYYTRHHVRREPDTLSLSKGSDSDYQVIYKAMNEEMYTSVLLSKNLPINCLLLVVYGKYNEGWKINILQIGEFTIDGKNSQDYYKLAKKYYDSGELLDASNMMVLTSQLASPAGEFFKYRNEDTLKNFFFKVMDDANKIYKFPFVVREVKSIPQIFSISPEFINEKGLRGVYPLIKYRTAIDLDNSKAVQIENDSLRAKIGILFPGVLQNNKYILYQAYNSTTDGKIIGRNFSFIQKTSK
jgi:hypothetical protein